MFSSFNSMRILDNIEAEISNMLTSTIKVDKENKTCIIMDVPGFGSSDLSIKVDSYVLSVTGSKETLAGKRTINKEFYISEKTDLDNIEAEVNNGILKILVPPMKPSLKKDNVKNVVIK